MQRVLSILLVIAVAGCATVQQEAVRTDATGVEYRLTQKTTVTAGGKLKEGQTNFKASYQDGAWKVASGTAADGAWSPDTVAAITGLVVQLAPYLLEGFKASIPAAPVLPEPAPINAPLE